MKIGFKIFVLILVFLILISVGVFFLRNKKTLEVKEQAVSQKNISVVIVPHHDVVKDKRFEFLKFIASKRDIPETTILISPDHFSPYQKDISVINEDWEGQNQTLVFDKDLASKFTNLRVNNILKRTEHGIFNLILEIMEIWPKSKNFPIAIGQQVEEESLDNFFDSLKESCYKNCLVIASVDFSHYLPADLANIHDVVSIKALEDLDLDKIKDVEVDSWQSLYVAVSLAKYINNLKWNLYSHTNSSEILDSPDTESTSHVMGWCETGEQNKINQDKTFIFSRNLDKDFEKESLGERFFYGNDWQEFNLDKTIDLTSNFQIEPSEATQSAILKNEDKTIIKLSDDLVVAGVESEDKFELVFAPMKKEGNQHFLLRGKEKKEYLEKTGFLNTKMTIMK